MKKNSFVAFALIIAALAASFLWGGGFASPSVPDGQDKNAPASERPMEEITEIPAHDSIVTTEPESPLTPEQNSPPVSPPHEKSSSASTLELNEPSEIAQSGDYDVENEDETVFTDENNPDTDNLQEKDADSPNLTCSLSVRCDIILDNIDRLDPEKVFLVPENGVIFTASNVTFYEGESVFNVLQREMKSAKIHMQFINSPIQNSAYIKGINNIYELDCGELSGWVYKVNGQFPNYSCSRYELKNGDVVEWVYSCDLGNDVGGNNFEGGS